VGFGVGLGWGLGVGLGVGVEVEGELEPGAGTWVVGVDSVLWNRDGPPHEARIKVRIRMQTKRPAVRCKRPPYE
jgi:hypothetical protein